MTSPRKPKGGQFYYEHDAAASHRVVRVHKRGLRMACDDCDGFVHMTQTPICTKPDCKNKELPA